METEAAFSIEPDVEGTFHWNASEDEMIFIPDSALHRKTQYKISLSTQAQNYLGAPLDSIFSFTFLTRQINELILIESFPSQGEQEISTRPQLYFIFSKVVSQNAILGNYEIRDEEGNFMASKSLGTSEENGKGVVVMEPRLLLKRNTNYIVSFFPGIVDW